MNTNPAKPGGRRATGALLGAAFVLLALAVVACAPYPKPHGRLALRGDRAIVTIGGRGEVTSPGLIACRPGRAVGCEGHWKDIGAASLVATPEPGWRFDRWEWRQVDAPIAPSFAAGGETYSYTAVFVPDGPVSPESLSIRKGSDPRQVSRCAGTAASTGPC